MVWDDTWVCNQDVHNNVANDHLNEHNAWAEEWDCELLGSESLVSSCLASLLTQHMSSSGMFFVFLPFLVLGLDLG